MRSLPLLLLLAAVLWAGLPLAQYLADRPGSAAWADSGSSDSDDDDDGDDDGNSGPGNSGPGDSGPGRSGPGGSAGGSTAVSASRAAGAFGPEGIVIRFADGQIERIRSGRYESFDARGRSVASRAAGQGDAERLRTLGTRAKRRRGAREVKAVVEVGEGGRAIEITDFRGWREIVTRGAYIVKDPNGRIVAERPVVATDIARILGMLDLD